MSVTKKALVRTQRFVNDHKVAAAVVTTATVTVVVMEKLRGGALRDIHEFLDERGLAEDFTNFVVEKANL